MIKNNNPTRQFSVNTKEQEGLVIYQDTIHVVRRGYLP